MSKWISGLRKYWQYNKISQGETFSQFVNGGISVVRNKYIITQITTESVLEKLEKNGAKVPVSRSGV